MVLVRLAYAADLPSPEEALKRLSSPGESASAHAPRGGSPASGPGGASSTSGPRSASSSSGSGGASSSSGSGGAPRLAAAQPFVASPEPAAPQDAPAVVLNSFADLLALAGTQRDIQIKTALERDVQLVRFEPGLLEFSLAPGGSPTLAAQLTRKLQDWTGQRWMVALSTASGAPSLVEQAKAKENERRVGVQAHPLVRAALEHFPGAVIVAVRGGETESPARHDEIMPAEADDVGYIEETEDEDF
jgi:DNA polymerase-3 subunit gamma/tau